MGFGFLYKESDIHFHKRQQQTSSSRGQVRANNKNNKKKKKDRIEFLIKCVVKGGV